MTTEAPNTPIPIAFLIGNLRRGGAELALTRLATGLDSGRFAPTVYLFQKTGPLVEVVEGAGVPIEVVDLAVLWSPRGLRALRRLVGMLRTQRPRILHSFSYGADVAAAVAGRLAGVDWIVTTRRTTGVANPRHRLVYRVTNPLVHHVLAVSEASRQWSIQHEGLSPERIDTIPNGVDSDRFHPADPPREGGAPVRIGTVGNVRPAKGLDLLLRAFARVRRANPAAEGQLLVAGRVKESYRPELDRLLAEEGMTDAVTFRGEVDDVPAFLRSREVFALPSVREGMSNALLEALATGLPVVATAVGGNAENVCEGEGGFLVRDRSVDAFTKALETLIADPELRRRFGAFNRRRAEEVYAIDAVVRATAAFYDDLMAGRFP